MLQKHISKLRQRGGKLRRGRDSITTPQAKEGAQLYMESDQTMKTPNLSVVLSYRQFLSSLTHLP